MSNDTILARWRTARRITLAAIVIAGTMATAAAVAQRIGEGGCHGKRGHHKNADYTYSGIGVSLTVDGDDFVVRHVFPGTPADGKIHPGAVLLSVDGETPDTMDGWSERIRGEAGTDVELELAYPCSGHETVELERAIIHVNY
ncbi:PDZ domain-containing protein [Nannocystaceae bacterium ST9]